MKKQTEYNTPTKPGLKACLVFVCSLLAISCVSVPPKKDGAQWLKNMPQGGDYYAAVGVDLFKKYLVTIPLFKEQLDPAFLDSVEYICVASSFEYRETFISLIGSYPVCFVESSLNDDPVWTYNQREKRWKHVNGGMTLALPEDYIINISMHPPGAKLHLFEFAEGRVNDVPAYVYSAFSHRSAALYVPEPGPAFFASIGVPEISLEMQEATFYIKTAYRRQPYYLGGRLQLKTAKDYRSVASVVKMRLFKLYHKMGRDVKALRTLVRSADKRKEIKISRIKLNDDAIVDILTALTKDW